MPMGRPSSSNQLPYDSGHYSFPHMFLQHTVEQDRAPHVLPHYPELARHASRQPPRGHRTDRKHHDENRSQNPLRTRSQPLSQGHQDLRRANGDTQHKARFLPSRMELQHLAQTFERGAIILGRRLSIVLGAHAAGAATIANWDFTSKVGAPDNSPAPSTGAGVATMLGMDNNYTFSDGNTITGAGTFIPGRIYSVGSVSWGDVTSTPG